MKKLHDYLADLTLGATIRLAFGIALSLFLLFTILVKVL